jgi:4-amino-4-deoxy-L-arabinose transferase-like glycosyltransferase
MRLAFAFRAPLFVVNDSLSYVQPAWELLHGQGFFPLFKRPPLYPLFVTAVLGVFGEDPQAIALVQHVLGLANVVIAFLAARLIGGRVAAVVASLLTALSATLIVTEHYLMSELLFSVLLCGALLLFLLAQQRDRRGLFLLTGACLGLAALTRPLAQVLVPILVLAILLGHRGRWRSAVVPIGFLVGAYLVVTIPWLLRNAQVQGAFTLAGGMGEGIAVRTIRYEQKFDFRATPGSEDPEPLRSARRIYRDEAGDGSAFELAARLRNELHVSPAEADALMRQIAVRAIARQPQYYALGTVDMFWKMLTGRVTRLRQDWNPWRGMVWDERLGHLLPHASPLQDTEFSNAERVTAIFDPARSWPLILGLALIGMLSTLRKGSSAAPLLLGSVVLVQLAVAAAIVGIEWRYRYPLDPLINVLVGVGVATVTALVRWPLARRTASATPLSVPQP